MDIKHEVARSLLSIEAVFLRPQEPFTWASGIKSPIYCDNRLILTAPEARDLVERAIAETVRREYPQAQVLMGTATAGIAHAAIAAHLLGLPMGYVRSSSKDHGRQNRIEGKLVPGQKVVVVEDLTLLERRVDVGDRDRDARARRPAEARSLERVERLGNLDLRVLRRRLLVQTKRTTTLCIQCSGVALDPAARAR